MITALTEERLKTREQEARIKALQSELESTRGDLNMLKAEYFAKVKDIEGILEEMTLDGGVEL